MTPRRLGLLAAVAAFLAGGSVAGAEGTVAPPSGGVIEVVGSASALVPPDYAIVEVSLISTAMTDPQARAANAAAVDDFRAFARKAGVSEAQISSSTMLVHPNGRIVHEGKDIRWEAGGYKASTSIFVRLDELAQVPPFNVETVKGGIAQSVITTFGLEDQDAVFEKVQAAAFADARRKAEQLAVLSGPKLGRVVRVSLPARDLGGANAVRGPARGADAVGDGNAATNHNRDGKRISVAVTLDVAWSAE